MMRLPSFHFMAPTTIDDAVKALAENPERTRLVAGGTDLYPNMKRRHQGADVVIGLKRLPALRGIVGDGTGEVTLGAMTTLTDICKSDVIRRAYPGFARSVASISAPVLRNMGTIGGNLCLDTRCTYYNQNEDWRQSIGYCMKEVGDTCWVAPGSPRCWAISASDSAPVLCAIGAKVKLISTEGERVISVVDLFRDDGIVYLTKRRDEILTEVILPAASEWKATYWKLRRRGSIDFPVLGVAPAIQFDDKGVVTAARLFLGAVASYPTEAKASADALVGKPLSDETIAEAARLARKPATPLDNTDFLVNWRKRMVEQYVDGALRELGGLPPKIATPPHGLWVA